VKYVNSYTKVTILCKKHGAFLQSPRSHLSGRGCKQCGIESSSLKHRMSTKEYVSKASSIHENYDYSETKYTGSRKPISVICNTHGKFYPRADGHLSGSSTCPWCNKEVSRGHKRLYDDLSKLTTVEINNRRILDNRYELDLYFPEAKFAIEVNGIYWHSSIFKEKHYHQEKFDEAEKKGIELLQIWDVELEENYDLILSMVKTRVGLVGRKIHARKTTPKEVDATTYQEFLKRNHLQGIVPSRVKIGLYYQDELVSVMGLSKRGDEWNLERFCSERGTVVVGGFSKILSYFSTTYSPDRIVTFSDGRYSTGKLYRDNGFSFSRENQPRLYYTDKLSLFNRRMFQKPNLKKSYPELYDEKLTEREIAEKAGFYQVWGVGTRKWILEKTSPSGV